MRPFRVPRDGPSRQRAFAVGLLVTGLLLFTWPFVRVPRFHVVAAYLHLLGAWAVVIAALGLLAGALAASARGRDGPDA
jgi:hypothetical protein